MKVDEGGEYRLSNFHGLRRGKKTTHGDHNIVTLDCKFEPNQTKPQRIELFNFKNKEGQNMFKELTTQTNYLSKLKSILIKRAGCEMGESTLLNLKMIGTRK